MTQPHVPKRLKKIVKVAVSQGWSYDRTRKDHPRLSPPAGLTAPTGGLVAPVTFALTPSDIRSDKNAVAALRRAGVTGI